VQADETNTVAEPRFSGLVGWLGLLGSGLALAVGALAIEKSLARTKLPNLKPAPEARIAAGVPWRVKLELPAGWKINDSAPSRLRLLREGSGREPQVVETFQRKQLQARSLEMSPLKSESTYRLVGTLYFCEARNPSICLVQSHEQVLRAVTVAEGESARTEVAISLSASPTASGAR
jgi:hypothetical protein